MPTTTKTILILILLFPIISFGNAVNDDLISEDLPVVLTPTRLRQSLADAPASVTIITADMLRNFGVQSIVEALRLVPGFTINQVTGSDYRVGYHGGNLSVPRRINVQIDGVSFFRPGFARVDWTQLPIAIEDIQRIEVTRGPNSATYGENSMMAIVNVISKHPRDTQGGSIAVGGGSLHTAEALASFSGSIAESTAYRVTFKHHDDSGYDFASTKGLGRDDNRTDFVSFRSISELGTTQSIEVDAGVLTQKQEIELVNGFQNSFPDATTKDYYLNVKWVKALSDHHDIQLQLNGTNHGPKQGWNSCAPTAMFLPEMRTLYRANPGYAGTILAGKVPSGGSSTDNALAAAVFTAIGKIGRARAAALTCLDTDQNFSERRYDFEFQDTYVFSPKLRVVAGLGAHSDSANSETYLNGRVDNKGWQAFSNIEYKPIKQLSFNVGGFFEDSTLADHAFSPRFALNGHITPNHTVRFVISKAARTPDIYEQRVDWAYHTTNWNPPLNGTTTGVFYQTAQAPGNLKNEHILSREIGYLGNYPSLGLRFDAKIFDDKLDDLISEKLQVSDFHPTNSNSAHERGGELQFTYQPNSRWNAYLTYGYLDIDATTPLERSIYARHSGSLGISYTTPTFWRFGFAAYSQGGNHQGQSFYGREDFIVGKDFQIAKASRVQLTFVARHLDNRSSTYDVGGNQIRESRFNNAMQYYVNAGVTF
jgi:iron complex outermembrane recepter protein